MSDQTVDKVDKEGNRPKRIARTLGSLLIIPLFFVGIFQAAKTGVALADRQVPPASTATFNTVPVDSRWILEPAVVVPAVARSIEVLREFDFRRSSSATEKSAAGADGIEVWTVGAEGAELKILKGSDRRYLKLRALGGRYDGEVLWITAKDLLASAQRKSS